MGSSLSDRWALGRYLPYWAPSLSLSSIFLTVIPLIINSLAFCESFINTVILLWHLHSLFELIRYILPCTFSLTFSKTQSGKTSSYTEKQILEIQNTCMIHSHTLYDIRQWFCINPKSQLGPLKNKKWLREGWRGKHLEHIWERSG